MKSKKWAILISFIITAISLIICIYLQFRLYAGYYGFFLKIIHNAEVLQNIKSIVFVFCSGLMASMVATLAISISDYFVERRATLESVFLESVDISDRFIGLEYLLLNAPRQLIINLFSEIDLARQTEKYNRDYPQYKPEKTSEKWKEEFLKYLWAEEPDKIKELHKTQEDKEALLTVRYNQAIQFYEDCIESAAKKYLRFKDANIKAYGVAYRRLDFLFGNKKIRSHIFNYLYDYQCREVELIQRYIPDFEKYLMSNKDEFFDMAPILRKLLEIQDSLIQEKDEYCKLSNFENDKFFYRHFNFIIDYEQVRLLKTTYGRKNKDPFPNAENYIITNKKTGSYTPKPLWT